jgi:hypothetical protein
MSTTREDDWTPSERAAIARDAPEFENMTKEEFTRLVQRYPTDPRFRELAAGRSTEGAVNARAARDPAADATLARRFPTMFGGRAARAPETDPVLRARYPSMSGKE